MFELIPQKSNKKAQGLVILFTVSALLMLFLSSVLRNIPYIWTVQLLAIILLTVTVFLVTRYIMKVFIYRITDRDGSADLTVTEGTTAGKKQVTVCRISLDSIKSLTVLEGEACSLRSLRRERKKVFDYRPDLLPDKSLLLLSDEGGDECYVCLSYDDGLYSLLLGGAQITEDEND